MLPIQIEQHEDSPPLWELTHMTSGDLEELAEHLSMSTVPLSEPFRELHKKLMKLLSSLDMPRAV